MSTSAEFNRTSADGDGNGATPISTHGWDMGGAQFAASPGVGGPVITDHSAPGAAPKSVQDVMYSDIGLTSLLNRLKQSIASARDFAAFLKKRSSLEEDQATGLKRLAKSQLESVRRIEVRGGSYAYQLTELFRLHEKLGDNGMQFALSLHQMHEDLNELSNNVERGRKQWKHEGLDAEKKSSDAEQAMQKAKARYDNLAEDYDRARTGDSKGSRRIGLKGPKSAGQHEQDLLRKTQAADSEYEERVKQAKAQREQLVNEYRPKAVHALQQLIHECDSGLVLQLQKFATFNEKLLLSNGLAISPLGDQDGLSAQKSLRQLVAEIDNDSDFNGDIGGHAGKVPRPTDIVYEQHHTLAPKQQRPNVPASNQQPSQPASQAPASQAPSSPLTVNTHNETSQVGSMNARYAPATQQPPFQSPPQHPLPKPPQAAQPQSVGPQSPQQPSPQMYQQTQAYQQAQAYQPPPQYQQAPPSQGPPPQSNQRQAPFGQGPPAGSMGQQRQDLASPTNHVQSPFTPQQAQAQHPLARDNQGMQSSQSPAYESPSALPKQPQGSGAPSPAQASAPLTIRNQAPANPVFGVSLDDLFARDESAVPMIVFQCLQAVDLFGLSNEGIYRVPGNSAHVNALRNAFDSLPLSAPQLDFRNPANFYHDVDSVTSLLKAFFRDLPDPLFTRAMYNDFIDAARVEDDTARRDALHQAINDLPDPNYATLRALVLHLHRITQNESRTRMGSSNLAVCFAPSLMGTHTGAQIADASLQARVLDTILINATEIFEED